MDKLFLRLWTAGFGFVDVILGIMILLGILRGYRNGLAKECGRLIELYMATVFSIHFSSRVARWLSIKIQLPLYFVHGVLFFALAFFSIVVTKMFLQMLLHIGVVKFTPFVEKAGGVLLGGLRFLLLTALVSYMLLLFRSAHLNDALLGHSRMGRFTAALPVVIHHGSVHLLQRVTFLSKLV